ncbi:uncharacterized protein LOC101859779, partial [Aplysia californica]|uniref:Uncharacterized protein LOC101859779 n=1 Tax=Aplysia californica TaxID=6500 RepID=A0ABM0ZXX1_APLCA
MDRRAESMDLSLIPPSTTTVSTVAVQAGRAKVVLAVLRSSEWVRVRVHQMEPDLMDVGSTLEEAIQLQREHEELIARLKSKEDEVHQLLRNLDQQADANRSQVDVHNAMADTLAEAWRDLNDKLAYRGTLLAQSVQFHRSAQDLASSMEQAQNNFSKVPLATDVETAQRLLQQHLDMKSNILESSKATLDMGQSLLDQIKEMGMHADMSNLHATTAACYGIEHLLELLHDRRRHLEELWTQRKIRLEHCLQLCQLDQEVNKILEWYREVGSNYLKTTELGHTLTEAQRIQKDHNQFEAQARDVQETMLGLLRTADGLMRRASVDAEGIRQRLVVVDREAESFSSRLDIRRKNIAMAVAFYGLAETALNKLSEVEVQLNNMDLPRNSSELAEQHSRLSQAIVDLSTEASHEGRLLLERVSSTDQGADGVRRKMDELLTKCSQLETLCKARRAEAWQRSQEFLQYQEKYSSLQTWLHQIGYSIVTRHNSMGTSLASAKDFLEVHEQLDEDIRDKIAELSSLTSLASALLKSGDQSGHQAAEAARDLEQSYQRLQTTVERRIQLSLMYVSFHRLSQQLSSNLDGLEHIVRSETEDLQEITDSAVHSLREMFSNTRHIFDDLNLKGKDFLQNATMVSDDSSLDMRGPVQTVERVLSDQRMSSVVSYWEAWEQHVMSSKQFKSQWHQFVQDARKTIDKVMQIENDFFPLISGELGDSLHQTNQLQARLDQFVPVYQEAQAEIEGHLKTAELLAAKGDTKGQKDQIVNELIKVHQRFQGRINEYQILLKMTIEFYRHIGQLDEMIERTEQEYLRSNLPSDLSQAETMLEQHKRKKTEVSQFINYTAEEGDRIVRRVRQQDASSAASDDVRHVLDLTDDCKRRWDESWEEQERRLRQNLQICQFNFDLRQIHSEIDQLHQHLQSRRGNYGTSLPNARVTSQTFKEFEKTVEVIETKIQSFISTAELMVQDRHYDSDNIRREADVLRNKWTSFHAEVNDYRSQLDSSIIYFTLIEECEQWMREGSQLLIDTGHEAPQCKQPQQADRLIKNLEKFVEDGKTHQEERLQKISDLATRLYGEQGTNKIRPLVVQYQDMMQAFEQADNELANLKDNLDGKSPVPVDETMGRDISARAAAPVPKVRPPKIVQHLKNAEVMEGDRFTFECRVDSDQVPEVRWYKDNLPLTSPDYETRFLNGQATLTIEETFSEDTARYTCRFTNEAGMAESSAYLTVKETHQQIIPPEFTKNLKSVELGEGSPQAFECHVLGLPSPTVSWFKDEINIDNSPEFIITKINGACCLKIRQAKRHHAARYTCRALNPGGEASSSARLTVIPTVAPSIQQPLQDVTAPEGKTLHLEVRFTGSPAPEVIWFRGSNRILPNNMYKITVTPTFSSLDIREAYAEDTGSYTVVVRNTAGEATSVCQVLIESPYSSPGDAASQVSTEMEPLPPRFVQKLPPTKDVPEGTRVRLDCVLVGHPEPEVIWFKNEKPVKESADIQLLFEGDRCTLVIREALADDSGQFKCVAQNPHGGAESACKLHVEPVSEMSDTSINEVTAPKFTQPLRDQQAKSGQRLCLQCRLTGHPLPAVTWYKDDHPLESSPDFQITAFADVHSLTIPEVFDEDSGDYKVKAVNPAGEATCVAHLTVAPVPEEESMQRKRVARGEAMPHTPPEFRKLFQDTSAQPGDSVTLECSVTGSPKPKVSWQFNGEPLVSQDYQMTMEGDTHRLTIPEVFDEDAGRFSVTAENPSGKATCSALLTVAPPLPLVPAPGPAVQRRTTQTQAFTVELPDGGYPSWSESEFTQTVTRTEKRVSHTFTQEERYVSSGTESHSETITTEVRPKRAKLYDRYASTVTTEIPPTFQPIDLTFEVPVPPNFVQTLKNIQALEGVRVTFEGFVTGKPEPVIRWYREGKQLTDQADFEVSYRDGRVTMSIPEVFPEDSGQFMVTAENPAGIASSQAELVVRAKLIPPAFVEKLRTCQAHEGEPVRLVVKVTGEPTPEVSWFRDGAKLVSSPDFQISHEGDVHSLYIPEAFYEDSGKFSVRADNPAGEAVCSAQLHVQPIPEKPQPLAIRAPDRKPVYEPLAPGKAPSVKSPRPAPEKEEQPSAKIPKLQRPSEFAATPAPPEERYRHELDMQIEAELPPFEARFKLYEDEPMPQKPQVPVAAPPPPPQPKPQPKQQQQPKPQPKQQQQPKPQPKQ